MIMKYLIHHHKILLTKNLKFWPWGVSRMIRDCTFESQSSQVRSKERLIFCANDEHITFSFFLFIYSSTIIGSSNLKYIHTYYIKDIMAM